MDINKEIENLIIEFEKEYKIMPYVYLDDETFIPGKSTVLYSAPYWNTNELVAGIKSLIFGKWLVAGNDVYLFESKFAKAINDKYALLVNSGSGANLVMLASIKKFMNWSDFSEILVSAVGFPTTVSVIPQNYLTPVFLDIEFDSLNIDLNLIEQKITNKTVALFLSPILGNPPNLDIILDICKKHNLTLILDGCDSLGSQWRSKYLNEYSLTTSESLYPAHILSVGQGGIVSSSNAEIIDLARSIATWGRSCSCQSIQNLLPNGSCNKRFKNWLSPNYEGIVDHRYVFDNLGYNMIPLEIAGSIGLEQLKKMDEIFEKRKYNYKIISELFVKYIDGIKLPTKLEYADPVWFGNCIICESKELKQKLVTYLEKNKIQTRGLFAGNLLIHKGYSYMDNYKNYPNSNKVLDQVIFTGNAPHYGRNILGYIEDVLKGFTNE
jgi:CDP-6-deoxy-D-xylo-4-hexulose-3-dehydrase